jgi:REP element-mobilizing transposase RayT
MDRFWLLTWTTYGTWLPGDARGFVSNVDRGDGKGHRINTPNVPPIANMPGLQRMARETAAMEVFLSLDHAQLLFDQFTETIRFRGWELQAAAIMRNHVHLVLGVPGDPEPDVLLRDMKSYGSRRLNQSFERLPSGTWWTESGSRRKLPNKEAVQAAVKYVENQEHPLLVWVAPRWKSI